MTIKEFFDTYRRAKTSSGGLKKLPSREHELEVILMAIRLGVKPYTLYKTRQGLQSRIHPLVEDRLKKK